MIKDEININGHRMPSRFRHEDDINVLTRKLEMTRGFECPISKCPICKRNYLGEIRALNQLQKFMRLLYTVLQRDACTSAIDKQQRTIVTE